MEKRVPVEDITRFFFCQLILQRSAVDLAEKTVRGELVQIGLRALDPKLVGLMDELRKSQEDMSNEEGGPSRASLPPQETRVLPC